jgi:mannose-6-phosphate isomerase-like protein (cupin superfamily)
LLSGAQSVVTEPVSLMLAAEAPEMPNLQGSGRVLVRGQRAIQPLMFIGGPREFDNGYIVHSGDEFIHVIAGRVQFELNGEGIYDLSPGDSLHYGSGIKHRWRQLGSRESRFLAVLTGR